MPCSKRRRVELLRPFLLLYVVSLESAL
jgi:hypothetical protein